MTAEDLLWLDQRPAAINSAPAGPSPEDLAAHQRCAHGTRSSSFRPSRGYETMSAAPWSPAREPPACYGGRLAV